MEEKPTAPMEPSTAGTPGKEDSGTLQSCCVDTIKMHALYNPMMVCSDCKQIIKCFVDESGYRNYLKFCESRRRPVQKGFTQGYHTIVFRSYDTYR